MITTSAWQLFMHITHLIRDIYEPDEARSISFLLLQDKLGLSRTQILSDKTITTFAATDFNDWIARLLRHEPIQYIVGKTEFLGRMFRVNPYVLIPRPETEELVAWVLEDTKTAESEIQRVLDIGTGSGCIAVSLAASMPAAAVWAIDISADALTVAQQNAEQNNSQVHFRQVDFLAEALPVGFSHQFDLIVSNPPYVTVHEQVYMQPNVLAHEPHMALFVPESDALIFYRRIAQFCQQYLSATGKYYVEINENLAPETAQVMQSAGLTATIRHDLFGKPRLLGGERVATKKN